MHTSKSFVLIAMQQIINLLSVKCPRAAVAALCLENPLAGQQLRAEVALINDLTVLYTIIDAY